ncbi:glycosyltransferase [Pseudomonas syringae]|uniref:glycosyltransferase n=1 Tax=Pseudomonas syringae TaxID=317 RepID=UPI0023F996EA|nr:glycosyltransferase [Pseudomonas syringae]MDF5833852.1 glycosyltransferase [Pseudomonas syringae]
MEHIADMDDNLSKGNIWPAHSLTTMASEVPDWPENIPGVSYSPFRPGQSPYTHLYPTREQITEDLLLIRPLTRHIRTYSVEGTLACIPEIAEALGMSVTLGVWITWDEKHNDRDLLTGVDLANRFSGVQRLLIGHEALLRNDVTVDQLIAYMNTARRYVDVPVSTSEGWQQWHETPELAEHADFIAAHILPFKEAVPVTEASALVLARADELKLMFPDKPLIISEVGWPGKGNFRRRITTYRAEQSIYLRHQLSLLEQHGHDYFVMEAFDQPWKTSEGLPGPHWGLFDARRNMKLQLKGPVKTRASWQSEIPRIIAGLQPDAWRTTAVMCAVAYAVLVWVGMSYAQPLSAWIALPIALAWATCLMIVVVTQGYEFLESFWGAENPRSFPPTRAYPGPWPKVSIHVPCYNEPPDMVKLTLDALQKLDYPDFEVLVIDNNTQDPNVWKPIQAYCRQLGARFRFFHVNRLSGFKAGALNYLLEYTAEDAGIVAAIDADYCAHRHWLKHMVSHFADPDIAVIQVPQDYRDGDESLFKRYCEAEYRVFFNIGMVIRNDHDAIIQHGTMTLIRKSVLQRLRWAEWCICEDAELGLRILEHGFSTGYAAISYGKGLMPDTFTDFKKQRYRWTYGAMQIFKRHAGSLLAGTGTALTPVQRYYFIAGWVPWMAGGVNYFLALAVLLWSMAMIVEPDLLEPVPWLFSASLLLMFVLGIFKAFTLYQRLANTDIKDALAAMLASTALYSVIGKAVLSALFTSGLPFFRTPKQTAHTRFGQAVREAAEDVCMILLWWAAIILLCIRKETIDPDLGFWITMLFAQSVPYLAAITMAVLSARATRPAPSTT